MAFAQIYVCSVCKKETWKPIIVEMIDDEDSWDEYLCPHCNSYVKEKIEQKDGKFYKVMHALTHEEIMSEFPQ